MERLKRRLMWLGIAIAVALATGTVGFTLIEGYDPFDAFYMTLTTITTVGYGDIAPVSPFARSLAGFEAVFGTLYPSTVIARLLTLR